MRRGGEQQFAFGERLMHEAKFIEFEIAQTAVDELRRGGRRALREIALLDEPDGEAAAGGVARDGAAVDPAADDEKIVDHGRPRIRSGHDYSVIPADGSPAVTRAAIGGALLSIERGARSLRGGTLSLATRMLRAVSMRRRRIRPLGRRACGVAVILAGAFGAPVSEFKRLTRQLFDRAQQRPLAIVAKRNRLAGRAGARGAADAMHIGFRQLPAIRN